MLSNYMYHRENLQTSQFYHYDFCLSNWKHTHIAIFKYFLVHENINVKYNNRIFCKDTLYVFSFLDIT